VIFIYTQRDCLSVLSLFQTHAHTHTNTHTHTHTYTHTNTQTHTLTRTHAHMHTQTLFAVKLEIVFSDVGRATTSVRRRLLWVSFVIYTGLFCNMHMSQSSQMSDTQQIQYVGLFCNMYWTLLSQSSRTSEVQLLWYVDCFVGLVFDMHESLSESGLVSFGTCNSFSFVHELFLYTDLYGTLW